MIISLIKGEVGPSGTAGRDGIKGDRGEPGTYLYDKLHQVKSQECVLRLLLYCYFYFSVFLSFIFLYLSGFLEYICAEYDTITQRNREV